MDAEEPPEMRQGPRLGDAFGALLMACWEGGAAPGRVLEVVERDDGMLTAGDAARYFAGPDRWSSLDRWACDRAHGRILNVGSGAGLPALPPPGLGRAVVALDVSPLAAEVCRRRGVRQVVTGTVAELASSRPEAFDTILLLGNNLGLLGGEARAADFLAAPASLAAPDAVIPGQGTDPFRTEQPIHRAYHRRNRQLGRLPGQLRLRVRHLDTATDWFDYLLLSLEELQSLLVATPWRLEYAERADGAYAVQLRLAAAASA